MTYSQSVRDTLSLVEQKKLQWAKEKEELAKLNEVFSTTTTTTTHSSNQFERTSIRTYYSNGDLKSNPNSNSNTLSRQLNRHNDTFNLHKNAIDYNGNSMMMPNKRNESGQSHAYAADFYIDNDGHYHTNDNNINIGMANDANKQQSQQRNYYKYEENAIRSPMLPPIERRTTNCGSNQMRMHSMNPNRDEDTSGYLSDASNFVYSDVGLSNGLNGMRIGDNKPQMRQNRAMVVNDEVEYNEAEPVFSMSKTPTSMCSENNNYLSAKSSFRKETEERAKWGDRNNHLYDSVSKESTSSVKSDGPCWLERSFADSGDESVKSYSFIRGQNAPIDPNILAERTTKRLKAIEFQNAIKAQVEERERLRKLEQQRMLAEENRRENSLRQQLESNERRIEEEQRKLRERIEKEQRKQEMMRIAIEKAREAADAEKARRKRSMHSNDDLETQYCEQTSLPADGSKRQSTTIIDRWENDKDENHQMPWTAGRSGGARTTTDSSDLAIDDGEHILIGSPIRMKKKTLNKAPKPMQMMDKTKDTDDDIPHKLPTKNGTDTNIDGLALVLQTLPPIMPILSNDIINLNQNINNLNTSNIQLAVMLAHLQQLNSMAQHHQMPDLLQAKSGAAPPPTPQTLTMPTFKPVAMENETPSMEMTKSHNVNESTGSQRNDDNGNENESPNNRDSTNLCKRCNQYPVCCSSSTENLKEIDGVNDITTSNKMDTGPGMMTNDIIDLTDNDDNKGYNKSNNNRHDTIIATNHNNDQHRCDDTKRMISVSTQTDRNVEVEVCFQCRYHECHHHHVIVNEDLEFDSRLIDDRMAIKTIAIKHHHSNAKIKSSHETECTLINHTLEQMERHDSNDSNGGTWPSTTINVTTSDNNNNRDNAKDGKMPIKIEDRPKWGVNRPLQQYIKASERDPFYLRNKQRTKKQRKRQIDAHKNSNDDTMGDSDVNEYDDDEDDDDDDDDDNDNSRSRSRLASPSPSILTNCTVTLSSPIHKFVNSQQQQQQQLQSTANQERQDYQQQQQQQQPPPTPQQHRTSSKRNICTEILPIKTDVNGRVYLNFREASLIMSEDEARQIVKPSSSHRNKKTKRITNRCRTMHDIIHSAPHQTDKNSAGIGAGNG